MSIELYYQENIGPRSLLLGLSQFKITSAYKEPRSSGNPEVNQTHLAIRKAIVLQSIKSTEKQVGEVSISILNLDLIVVHYIFINKVLDIKQLVPYLSRTCQKINQYCLVCM